jgi:prepilin-type N-terminal cleavage/methylation domain-containing protein
MRPRTLRNNKGFTLIELMIVVVIIGILAALAIPRFGQASDRAKEKEADGILKQIHTMQQAYKAQTGAFGSLTDIVQVGFEMPTADALKHYTIPTIAGDCATMAKSPGSATHSDRFINLETGAIGNTCAATPTP